MSLELFYAGEKIYPKTKNIARTNENVTFGNTISSSCAKPQEDQEHTDGEMTHRKQKSLNDILIAAKLSS